MPNGGQQQTGSGRKKERGRDEPVRRGLCGMVGEVGDDEVDAEEEAEGVRPNVDGLVVPTEEAASDQTSKALAGGGNESGCFCYLRSVS